MGQWAKRRASVINAPAVVRVRLPPTRQLGEVLINLRFITLPECAEHEHTLALSSRLCVADVVAAAARRVSLGLGLGPLGVDPARTALIDLDTGATIRTDEQLHALLLAHERAAPTEEEARAARIGSLLVSTRDEHNLLGCRAAWQMLAQRRRSRGGESSCH